MGGFADGLNAGANLALSAYNTKMYAEDRQRRNERQDKQWAREDATQSAIDKANQAARTAFDQHRSEFEKANGPKTTDEVTLTQGGVDQPGLTLSGQAQGQAPTMGGNLQLARPDFDPQAVPGAGQALALGGTASAPIPTQQVTKPAGTYDEREGVLAGLSARRKTLMDNNVDAKLWMDDWGKEAQLRSQIRGEKIDGAEKRFLATGDPGEYAKVVYPLIDDGYDFVGSQQVKGLNGKPEWQFTRRDQTTGKEVTSTMDADQFQRFMMGVRDPAKVMDVEAKSLIDRLRADQKIREEAEKQKGVRETNRQKSGLTLGEIGARTAGDLQVTRARGAEDRATNKAKPLVLAADATAYGQEDTPDGTKMVPIAKGSSKADKRYTAKDLNTMVIDNYGVSDMGGKAMGSDGTARISAAAEILLRSNPGMGANEAIVKAAKDLNLNITPKN